MIAWKIYTKLGKAETAARLKLEHEAKKFFFDDNKSFQFIDEERYRFAAENLETLEYTVGATIVATALVVGAKNEICYHIPNKMKADNERKGNA